MARLGFDRISGFVYEGRSDPTYPVWPNPVLSQATLIESPQDLLKIPVSFESHPFTWMFREDSFDPISKIRRGRLFQKLGGNGWEHSRVEAHPAINSELLKAANGNGRVSKELTIYIECTNLLQKPRCGEGSQLALGIADTFSMWRIIQVERTANLDVLVVLRSESAFGILPDLETTKILPSYISSVRAALERVLNAAYKELPTSVVDQCRNAATVIVSRWMWQQTASEIRPERDLGDWITQIRNHFPERPRMALCGALDVIRLLHPRGKDNERMRQDLRPVTDGDAEIAIHAIGFVLREVGWAKT